MTDISIRNCQALTPKGFINTASIECRDGLIVDISDTSNCLDGGQNQLDLNGNYLLPGFIDLQVNGGGGVLFNDCPSVEGIEAIAKAHQQFGTTGFLPTLITDNMDVVKKAINAVDEAIARNIPGVFGIHLEGPFLNPEKCGVHDREKITSLGHEDIEILTSLKRGKTLITLAPECTQPSLIRALRQRGAVVSAGHSLAGYDDAKTALGAGLTGFTHLFNAMAPLNSRKPGLIAAALDDERAWCGIIADGFHVHPAMLNLAYRAKVGDQMFLVTDAMPSVGATHKAFSLGDVPILVKDGKCVTKEGRLAGSDLDMWGAVRNAMKFLDIDLETAVKMASAIPASFLGISNQVGEIRHGRQANFAELDSQQNLVAVWTKGERLALANRNKPVMF